MDTFIARFQEDYLTVVNRFQEVFNRYFLVFIFVFGMMAGSIAKFTTEHLFFTGYQDYQIKKSLGSIDINQAQERIIEGKRGSLAFQEKQNICSQ